MAQQFSFLITLYTQRTSLVVNVITVTLHQNSSLTDLYNIKRNECDKIMVKGLENNSKTLNSLGIKLLNTEINNV